MNKLRFISNELGLPIRSIDNNLIYFDGNKGVVDTGVSIDGSENNFGIMLSFSLPLKDTGENQYIANGTGRRFIFMMHKTGDPLNVLHIGFGSQIFQLTLDATYNFHAMIVNWNKDTGEFQFSIDGLPLSNPIPGNFYSFTNFFYLGAFNQIGDYCFNGYLGGGVLSSNIITNNTWLEFWEINKDKKPIQEEIFADCNNYRFCDEPIKCGELTLLDCEEFLYCSDEITCFH
jgi:hypothetical protein